MNLRQIWLLGGSYSLSISQENCMKRSSNVHVETFHKLQFLVHISANPWFVELESRSARYQGQHALTENGVVCQRWDAQIPRSHLYSDPRYFPDATVEEAGNYCRRLDAIWLWCYTISGDTRWDWCGKLELLCTGCKLISNFEFCKQQDK